MAEEGRGVRLDGGEEKAGLVETAWDHGGEMVEMSSCC